MQLTDDIGFQKSILAKIPFRSLFHLCLLCSGLSFNSNNWHGGANKYKEVRLFLSSNQCLRNSSRVTDHLICVIMSPGIISEILKLIEKAQVCVNKYWEHEMLDSPEMMVSGWCNLSWSPDISFSWLIVHSLIGGWKVQSNILMLLPGSKFLWDEMCDDSQAMSCHLQ